VSYEFGSERNFVEQQRRASLATKLLRVIEAQAHVSEGEVREAVERRLEQVRIAFVVLGGDAPAPALARDDAAVQAYLAAHEAEVRKLYDERSDEFDVPERTRSRHILLRVPPNATPEQLAELEARANKVRERLVAGEDFAAVAREVSEDPGSAGNGGDLGYFRRGQMVPAFDEVAFSLEPGAISDVVRSDYGFHIIRVEDRKPASFRSFEEVRADLAFELMGREAAREQARAEAEELAGAVRGGQSLEQAAREARLTLQRSGALNRRPDGFVPGLGAAQDLMAVAFTLEPGQSSPRVFEVGDQLALVQVLAHERPKPEDVDRLVAAERTKMENERLEALADTWIAERRNRLLDSGDLVVNLKALGRS
jgi:parvulin-like peptidyl-prolyl isomerase